MCTKALGQQGPDKANYAVPGSNHHGVTYARTPTKLSCQVLLLGRDAETKE